MNTFLKFGVFNLLMITGWFQLYGDETAEKLSEIEKQVDAMMERIQQLKTVHCGKTCNAIPSNPKAITIPQSCFGSPLAWDRGEFSGSKYFDSRRCGTKCELTNIHRFGISDCGNFSGTVALYEESTQSFIPVDRGFMIEKETLMRVPYRENNHFLPR